VLFSKSKSKSKSKFIKFLSLLAVVGVVVSFSACSNKSSPAEELSVGEIANRDFVNKLNEAQLKTELLKGGHIVYFRHTQTDKDYADQADPKFVLGDCATQRKLSEQGIADAKSIGAAFTKKNIPVGDVIASDYCRAWQGADLAFGKHAKDKRLNFLPFEDYTDAQVQAMKTTVMPLLTATPQAGKNTIIFGHDDIFEAATGIYVAPQGTAYVLTPDGNGSFIVQAKVSLDRWGQL
jgi:phosphohistidine phosphatase SixA